MESTKIHEEIKDLKAPAIIHLGHQSWIPIDQEQWKHQINLNGEKLSCL